MKYCVECGTKLEMRFLKDEGDIPFCPNCNEFRFPIYNCAVSMEVLNPEKNKVVLIKQYGRDFNVLVAGYINKGESAEEAVKREVKEELGLNVKDISFNKTEYFEPSNTLMINFSCVAYSEDLSGINHEVDEAKWFTFDEAVKEVKQASLAQKFLVNFINNYYQKP